MYSCFTRIIWPQITYSINWPTCVVDQCEKLCFIHSFTFYCVWRNRNGCMLISGHLQISRVCPLLLQRVPRQDCGYIINSIITTTNIQHIFNHCSSESHSPRRKVADNSLGEIVAANVSGDLGVVLSWMDRNVLRFCVACGCSYKKCCLCFWNQIVGFVSLIKD